MEGFKLYDLVERNTSKAGFGMSDNLARQCFAMAMERVRDFLNTEMLLTTYNDTDVKDAFKRFSNSLKIAHDDSLIDDGGVPEKNYLAL